MDDTKMHLARQSLIGLSVGDAFGETMFGEPEQSAKRTRDRMLVGYRPWKWTDDTAMALSIVDVLEQHGKIDPDALATGFVRRWIADMNRGYGPGAYRLLTRLAQGADWRVESRAMFGGSGSYGNGAAMRAAPIGAYFAHDVERACDEARISAEPTHAHVEGAAGAIAVAAAAALVAGRHIASRAVVETDVPGRRANTDNGRVELIARVAELTPPSDTRTRLFAARDLPLDTPVAQAGDMLGTGRDVAAFDTVPFCIWIAARHLDSYEDALWAATSQLGDRDTTGAIVGGIVVLATGEAAIPSIWREATEPLPG